MKKRRTLLAVSVLIAICFSLLSAQAQAASEDKLTFDPYGDGYRVTDCVGSASGTLTVPATYNGKPVTHIKTQAFDCCSGLTSIIISDGVKYIGDFAFYECSNLVSVTLPESILTINAAAFKNCTKLSAITIPNGVTRISESAFYNCDSLTSVKIPDNIHYIDACAFQYCSNLVSIDLPDSNCYIKQWAFDWCTNLTSINIPNGMTKIEQYTFNNCKNLTTVSIPATVTSIDHHAFDKCSRLTEVIYCGTEDQWNSITVDGYNESLLGATLRYHDWTGTGTQRTCSVCKLASDGHEHVWKEATCTVPKTCAVCALTEGEPTEHSYNAGVITTSATCKEEGVRTHTCTDCSATKTEKIAKLTTHTYHNTCDTSCDVCGQLRTVEHDYQTIWTKDSIYHWHECSVCANKSDSSLHTPGAAATEKTPQTCTVCGYVITQALGVQNTEPTEPVPTEPATEPTVEPTAEPTEPTAPDTKATEGTQPALPTEPSAAEPTEPMKEKEKEGVCWWVTAMIGVVCFVLGGTLVGILLWKKKE